MAWETRKRGNGRRYYTRSRKVDGRVVREYIGGGERGERAAAADDLSRKRRAVAAADWQRERAGLAETEAQLAEWYAAVEIQVHAALTAAGYHQHSRGEWRRKRGTRSGSTSRCGSDGSALARFQ
jgi:hypothetical protein